MCGVCYTSVLSSKNIRIMIHKRASRENIKIDIDPPSIKIDIDPPSVTSLNRHG